MMRRYGGKGRRGEEGRKTMMKISSRGRSVMIKR